ncbi:MAG: hypothetical protein GYA24_07070 [Candidatus Lokiarchaeota archaeon]|nr:hypothetical protein [Candidatus Lokiarchaeota archaeon]
MAAMLALARKIEPKTSKIALVVTIGFWGAIAWLAGRETLSRLAALAALGILPESAWFRVTFSTLTSSIWHLISIVNFAFLFRKHTRVSSSSQPGLVINMTPAIFRIALASAGNVAIALIQIIISI